MSHIFDALLKSESDHAGRDNAPGSVTEILRQAERRAATQWKPRPEKQRVNPVSSQPALAVTSEELPAIPIDAVAPHYPAILEERSSFFDRFASISVQLPNETALVAHRGKESAPAEAFRLLAVRLRHIRKDRQLQKVLITSTLPEEGKSTVAANLASTLGAGSGQKILLLEADVRRPSLTGLFQMSNRSGLCEWLQHTRAIEECIYRIPDLGIWILPAGRISGNPQELLQSPRLAQAVEELQHWFDWIIIDTPPVLPLADTSVLAKLADGILLVTRRGVTQKKVVQRGIEALDRNKVLGAVINSSRKRHHDYYYYGAPASPSTPSAE